MRRKTKKTILIFVGSVLLFLTVTNPGMQRFKEFDTQQKGNSRRLPFQRRVSNFFIYSVYETSTDRYLGIAGNFFDIGN